MINGFICFIGLGSRMETGVRGEVYFGELSHGWRYLFRTLRDGSEPRGYYPLPRMASVNTIGPLLPTKVMTWAPCQRSLGELSTNDKG